jgi:transposase
VVGKLGVSATSEPKEAPRAMLHAGLDLSRKRVDYCLLGGDDEEGIERGVVAPDGDGLRGLVRLVELRDGPRPVHAVIESMNGARFRLYLVRHRSSLKQRVHSSLMAFGHGCPVADLFGRQGRELLERLQFPEPWRTSVLCAVAMIDDLERRIDGIEGELRALGADHPYVAPLVTVPGISWVLGYTIAAEIGDINRFTSPTKLVGYTGLCPRVYQSGSTDRRGPLAKHGPKYLRWALMVAATNAAKHPLYRDRYRATKARIGRQRGAKVAQIQLARTLAEAIWHMLTRNQTFAPAGAPHPLAA